MANFRLMLLPLSLVIAQAASAAWSVIEPDDPGSPTIAYSENSTGQTAEIFVGAGQTVYLRVSLGKGFESFAETSCPTFQIDDRKPMHHFELGRRCVIDKKVARFTLGRISDRAIESLVLHRFMNGNNVAFRYTTNNGQYRRAQFNLRNSKQALKRAIGTDTSIAVP